MGTTARSHSGPCLGRTTYLGSSDFKGVRVSVTVSNVATRSPSPVPVQHERFIGRQEHEYDREENYQFWAVPGSDTMRCRGNTGPGLNYTFWSRFLRFKERCTWNTIFYRTGET